jgi:hypothetical protein
MSQQSEIALLAVRVVRVVHHEQHRPSEAHDPDRAADAVEHPLLLVLVQVRADEHGEPPRPPPRTARRARPAEAPRPHHHPAGPHTR